MEASSVGVCCVVTRVVRVRAQKHTQPDTKKLLWTDEPLQRQKIRNPRNSPLHKQSQSRE